MKLKATAHVQITILVHVDDVWGGECPAEQIVRQARESAIAKVGAMIGTNPRILIIGNPVVTFVSAMEKA